MAPKQPALPSEGGSKRGKNAKSSTKRQTASQTQSAEIDGDGSDAKAHYDSDTDAEPNQPHWQHAKPTVLSSMMGEAAQNQLRGDGILVQPCTADRIFGGSVPAVALHNTEADADEDFAENEPEPAPRNQSKHRDFDYQASLLRMIKSLCSATHVKLNRFSNIRSRGESQVHGNKKIDFSGDEKTAEKNTSKPDKTSNSMHRHLDYKQPPVSNLHDIMAKIATKGWDLQDEQKVFRFQKGCAAIFDNSLRVFTMCSGTEAPILALNMIREHVQKRNHDLNFTHIASAEIEPFKQGYIERNFSPPLLFRDVTEFRNVEAHTAYGAKVKIPEHCDLVVAGSACVDYSALNSLPRSFGEKGESYDTMKGISRYCRRHKPAVVILENVKGAPWSSICEYWYHKNGYDVVVMQVDTKDFYIPQTRQRGYLVGFNRERAKAAGFSTERGLRDVLHFCGRLQQRASSPYTDFIYKNDSAENERARRMVETSTTINTKEQDWSSCRHRYANLRVQYQFGDARPYTAWRENGTSQPPDQVWMPWMRKQVPRIQDTLEIGYMRYLYFRDFDMSGKSRTMDLSQNSDRDLDSKHWGIVGCVTPAGLLYDTYRGGPISGIEALKLQGIPTEDLNLEKLSSRQMHDLAGNAMSTTVIASILVSVIAAATQDKKSIFSTTSNDSIREEEQIKVLALMDQEDTQQKWAEMGLHPTTSLTGRSIPDVHDAERIFDIAKQTRQLCACEGARGMKAGLFKFCSRCHHTVCEDCAGNSKHDFNNMHLASEDRQPPSEFVKLIETTLPRSLRVQTKGSVWIDTLRQLTPFDTPDRASQTAEKGNGSFAAALYRLSQPKEEGNEGIPDEVIADLQQQYQLCGATVFDEPFHFRGMTRGTCWTAIWSSNKGRLELSFTPTRSTAPSASGNDFVSDCHSMKALWKVFAYCPAEVSAGSMLRAQLDYPLAVMEPAEGLFDGCWSLHGKRYSTARIHGSRPTPALESRISASKSDFGSLKTCEKLSIALTETPIRSTSPSSPRFQDFDYLQDCGTENSLLFRSETPSGPQFMMLNPGHLQDAKFDCMVITADPSRVARTKVREVRTQFASGWRPVYDSRKQEMLPPWNVIYEEVNPIVVPGLSFLSTPGENVFTMWQPADSATNFFTHSNCRLSEVLTLAFEMPITSELEQAFGDIDNVLQNQCICLDLNDRRGKLKNLSWYLHAIDIPAALRQDHAVPNVNLRQANCAQCVPLPLSLSWYRFRKRKAAQAVLRPMENPVEAGQRETELKWRPMLAKAILNIARPHAMFELSLNIQSLVHRAVSPLARHYGNTNGLKAQWRIERHDPFDTHSEYKMPSLGSNDNDPEIGQPTSMKRHLWPTQLKTLSWMLKSEAGSIGWNERNVVDHCIKALHWKLRATASRAKIVRGGLLADGVGTGKTIVAYGLVGNDLDNGHSPFQGLQSHHDKGRPTDATLIVVPASLMTQWTEQAEQCFSGKLAIVNIGDFAELKSMSIDKLESAHIILVAHKVLEERGYWESLRELCCMPTSPMASGRALTQWLDIVMKRIDSLATASQRFQDVDVAVLNQQRQVFASDSYETAAHGFPGFRKNKPMTKSAPDALDLDKFKASDGTTRRQIQSIRPLPSELTMKTNTDVKDCDLEQKFKDIKTVIPFLHLFHFRRIIVDEFQYLTPRMSTGLVRLGADSRWLFSGTAPIENLDDVDQIARLLGTRITARPDDVVLRGFYGNKAKAKLQERSYIEEFEDYRSGASNSSIADQNKLAVDFLSDFARRNTATTGALKVSHEYYAIKPSARELAIFCQFQDVYNKQALHLGSKVGSYQSLKHWSDSLEEASAKDKSFLPGVQRPSRTAAIARMFLSNQAAETTMISCFQAALQDVSEADKAAGLYRMYQQQRREFLGEATYFHQRAREFFGYSSEGTAQDAEKKDFGTLINDVIDYNTAGDYQLTLFLDDLLGDANLNPLTPEKMLYNLKKSRTSVASIPRDSPALKVRDKEIGCRASDLRVSLERLVAAYQPMQFLQTLSTVASGGRASCALCPRVCPGTGIFGRDESLSSREKRGDYSEFLVLVGCGHVVCRECAADPSEMITAGGRCFTPGCTTRWEPDGVVPASRFAPGIAARDVLFGTRPALISKVIKGIIGGCSDADPYVVVFLQYEPQVIELCAALDDAETGYTNACNFKTNGDSVRRTRECIQDFRNRAMIGNKGSGDRFHDDLVASTVEQAELLRKQPVAKHVLLLLIDSEDASGWNLQVCSHVIFAAPYVGRSRSHVKSVMKQAVGRALRVGQPKEVQVYHFAMAYTNEVNMLEDREGGGRVLRWEGDLGRCGWVGEEEVMEGERLSGPRLDRKVGGGFGGETVVEEVEDEEGGEDMEEEVEE